VASLIFILGFIEDVTSDNRKVGLPPTATYGGAGWILPILVSMFAIFSSPLQGVTISLETLSLLYSSQNTNQITNGLVWVGSFDSNLGQTNQAARPDTGANSIASIFSTNSSTTRSNLTNSFTVFAEGAVLQGGVNFVGREYSSATNATTTTNGSVNFIKSYDIAPTFTNTPSLFLLIFNEATVESATEMLIFRPGVNAISGPNFPEGDDNLASISLEASPTGLTFFELFFGTWGETALENNPNFSGFFRSAPLDQIFGITSSSTASATNGSPFSYQIVANNGPISYAATGMPAGLQIDTPTGLISGVPNDTARTYSIVLQSVGGTVTSTQTLTLTLSAAAGSPPVVVTTTNVVSLFAGVSYINAYTIVATNAATNPPITSYGASNLPTGLSVNTNTGVISGMPTQLVTNRIIPISAYNGATGSGQFTLTINSPTLSYPSLTFTAGSSSSSPVPTVTAGYSPTSFTASNLPTGLSINSSGVIQGSPTIGGTVSTSTITAVDASGVASSVSQVITVNTLRPTINSAPVYTILNRTNATPYVITTTLTSTVVAPSAFSVSSGSLPTGMSLNTSSGVISGTPTSGKGITVVGLRADNEFADGSPVPGGGKGPEFDLTIRVDLNPPVFTETLKKNYSAGFPLNNKSTALLSTDKLTLLSTANDPETFSLSGAPSWLSIANDGKISGTPPSAGTWIIPVTIANTTLAGLRQSITSNLTITAVSSAATAASLGVRPGTFFLNQSLALTYPPAGFFVTGQDMGADSVTSVNILGLPPGVTFASLDDRRRGLLTGTPTAKGSYPCTVYVSNPKGFTRSTMTFVVQ
jgi:hypothetical protein